ncbi:hypothetical protein N7466_001559 [Penicillium verhagenii]|uniref:uncharacterized protein n=1 Tax=Penicillium verhagenii TaxID=1562060 RepID=UPI0025451C43|nr:uncharacterized protein N7466_001559 [Penicillium verhagenii]KAJ5938425.1 hypothetical protein N7466_001559 [Penicillium verhagenii]
MERSELPTVSPNPPGAAQTTEVTPNSPSNDEFCQADFPEFEKEDAVDWDSWLTPEALSGEGPPRFG